MLHSVMVKGRYVETCRVGSDPNRGLLKRALLGSSLFLGWAGRCLAVLSFRRDGIFE
jgi:hypothetical protein